MSEVNVSKPSEYAEQKCEFKTGNDSADSSSRLIDECHRSPLSMTAACDKAKITPLLSLPEFDISKSDKTLAPRAKASETAPAPVPIFSTDFMDKSVSPRKDFYQYADGQWKKDNPIPNDRSGYSGAAQLSDRNQYQIKEILEIAQADKSAALGSSERRVGDFYASAMNTERIEKLGLQPVKPTFDLIDSAKNNEDLFRVLADLQKSGNGGIFGVDVQPDAKESTVNALQLSQGGLSLPDRDYYLSDSFAKERSAYQEHIIKMCELEGKSPEQAAKDAATVIAMETGLKYKTLVKKSTSTLNDPRDAEK